MNGVLLLKAQSPITHGAETAGNEQIIRREKVMTPIGERAVPIITGNSLRHRLIREPIANVISDGWKMTKEQLRWLFNGGALDGKSPDIDVNRIADCCRLLPHIEALGCSMPDTILAGKLEMGIAWLACMETQPIIRAIVPDGVLDGAPLLPAHEFVSRSQYYRHDAVSQRRGSIQSRRESLLGSDDDGKDYSGMPHGGEHVVPGAIFLSAFHAPGLSDLAASAVIFAFEEWAKSGATIGGSSSRGHGVVEPYLLIDRDVTSDLFRDHLDKHLDEIRTFVSKLYIYTREKA